MANEQGKHDGPDGMTPVDSPRRAEADHWAKSTIAYGQSVTSGDPEVAAGSNAAAAERRIERAEGEGQPEFIPDTPDPTRNHDRDGAAAPRGAKR